MGLIEGDGYPTAVVDTAIYVPIFWKREEKLVKEIKLGIGAFRPIPWTPQGGACTQPIAWISSFKGNELQTVVGEQISVTREL